MRDKGGKKDKGKGQKQNTEKKYQEKSLITSQKESIDRNEGAEIRLI